MALQYRTGGPQPAPVAGGGLPVPQDVSASFLGDVPGVSPGQTVDVDLLEGGRPTLTVPIAGLVEDALALSAYMDIDALHRLMWETRVLSGASLRCQAPS